MENKSTVSKKLYDATGKQVCSQTKRNSKSYRIKSEGSKPKPCKKFDTKVWKCKPRRVADYNLHINVSSDAL